LSMRTRAVMMACRGVAVCGALITFLGAVDGAGRNGAGLCDADDGPHGVDGNAEL
jgi:hypothetical protein